MHEISIYTSKYWVCKKSELGVPTGRLMSTMQFWKFRTNENRILDLRVNIYFINEWTEVLWSLKICWKCLENRSKFWALLLCWESRLWTAAAYEGMKHVWASQKLFFSWGRIREAGRHPRPSITHIPRTCLSTDTSWISQYAQHKQTTCINGNSRRDTKSGARSCGFPTALFDCTKLHLLPAHWCCRSSTDQSRGCEAEIGASLGACDAHRKPCPDAVPLRVSNS